MTDPFRVLVWNETFPYPVQVPSSGGHPSTPSLSDPDRCGRRTPRTSKIPSARSEEKTPKVLGGGAGGDARTTRRSRTTQIRLSTRTLGFRSLGYVKGSHRKSRH